MRKFNWNDIASVPVTVPLSVAFLCVMFMAFLYGDWAWGGYIKSDSESTMPDMRMSSPMRLAGGSVPAPRDTFTPVSPPALALEPVEALPVDVPPPTALVVDPLQLPFERQLMSGDAMTDQVMTDQIIDRLINKHESNRLADPEAIAMTRLYEELARRTITAAGADASLRGLVCGIQICVGVLAGGKEQDYSNWTALFSERTEIAGSRFSAWAVPEQGRPVLHFMIWTSSSGTDGNSHFD